MTNTIQQAVTSTPDYQAKPSHAMLELRSLSAVRRLDEMKSNLENEHYIFNEIALAGQITLIYSKAGSGKTLLFMHFIKEAIQTKSVNAEDIIYINADDNYSGLHTKTEIAKSLGFDMISPDEANIPKERILNLLDDLVKTGEIKGKIIIIDTLKKFADMMSKADIKELLSRMRRITAKAGTVIIAGHANKNVSPDGKLVYEGTADTINDVDCVYSINLTSEPEGDVTVELICEKSRGDNVYRATYGYQKVEGLSYQQMVDSVHKIITSDNELPFRADIRNKLDEYESEILFVKRILKEIDQPNESEIIRKYKENKDEGLAGEITESRLRRALKEFDGTIWLTSRDARNNAKNYRLKSVGTYQAK